MRGRKNLALRGFAMILLALGVMSMGATSVSAQAAPTCVDEPGLAFFDTNEDGVLSITELQEVADTFPDDAELQALVQQAADDPNFGGIQYDGNCNGTDPDPTATTDPGDPDPDPTTPPTNGNGDDDDDDDVGQLPDTGQGSTSGDNNSAILMIGVGSVLALVGAFALRLRSQA